MSKISNQIEATIKKEEFDGDLFEKLPRLIAEFKLLEQFVKDVHDWREEIVWHTTLSGLEEKLKKDLNALSE